MRLLRYIFVPWSIFLIYFIFSAIFGQNGTHARRHLELEQQLLVENLEALEMISDEYQRTKESLIHDQDALSVYARQLGFGRHDEEFIRIMGLGIAINADMPTEQVLYATSPAFFPDKTIKIIAIVFGMLVFIFLLTMDFLSFKVSN